MSSTVLHATKCILHGTPPAASKSLGLQLLIHAAYIHPVGRGLYSLLPNGQRAIKRLNSLIDNELDSIGAQKLSFPILGPKELWDQTNRWDSMGAELLTVEDRLGNKLCLQPTAEEMCTQLMAQLPAVKQRAFPLMLYQTTEKFRDEMNPRFGLLRARQFLMNDLYSFDISEESAMETYGVVSEAYGKILTKALRLQTYKVRADSGIHGGRLSHEYHLRNPLNEDSIHYCDVCKTGGKVGETEPCNEHNASQEMSTVEIAHTFQLGTKYTEALGVYGLNGQPLEMCCFGIGVTRLLQAAAEVLSPSNSCLRLPSLIVPYDAAVVVHRKLMDRSVVGVVVDDLKSKFSTILLDDRTDISIGKRILELNRIGVPRIIVLGTNTLKSVDSEETTFEVLTSRPYDAKYLEHGDRTRNEYMQILSGTDVDGLASRNRSFVRL